MTYISKPRSANSENQKLNILDWLSKRENWQWTPLNSKEYWTGLHQKTVKEVQSFLRFGNFYRRFVKGFSHLSHSLNDILKKDKKFVWSEECQESFDQLKKRFTKEPVLMMPDHSKPFQIQVDSSLFATGGILSQMDTNGDRHPCAYLSKSLTKEQRNYDTGDRELLAIVWALKEWRHYIQGSGHTTIVLSDHDNL
jgi:RNase H-like domain found in reverse transcriptase